MVFIIPLLFSPITPSVSNPVNNYMCTFYSAPIWTNHISHHIHTSDNNPIGFINSLRIWLKVHIILFFRSLLPVISLKIDITWLVVGRVSPPTVSRIETANDLYTKVTHIPKEHLSIKYPSGKCLVMQKIDFIISL